MKTQVITITREVPDWYDDEAVQMVFQEAASSPVCSNVTVSVQSELIREKVHS